MTGSKGSGKEDAPVEERHRCKICQDNRSTSEEEFDGGGGIN